MRLERFSQSLAAPGRVVVYQYSPVAQVKGYVVQRLRKEQDRLVHGVGNPDFVEDVRVLAGQVGYHNICLLNRTPNIIHDDTRPEYVICSNTSDQAPDLQSRPQEVLVYNLKILGSERHYHKSGRTSFSRFGATIVTRDRVRSGQEVDLFL